MKRFLLVFMLATGLVWAGQKKSSFRISVTVLPKPPPPIKQEVVVDGGTFIITHW